MIRDQYDTWHSALDAAERGADLERATGTWYDMVRPRLGRIDGLRVLEVGCGRGSFAIELARMGARVTALDFSSAAISIARQRAEGTGVVVDFQVADARKTGLPDASFDLIVSCECLEHVAGPEAMARELFRLCRPGGRCVLTTPSYLNGMLISWAYSFLRGRPFNSGAGVQPHENFFLFFGVRKMLKQAGYEIMDEESRIFQWLLLPRVDPARLRVVAFGKPWLNRLARPFGLHFLFDMRRPELTASA